MTKKILKKCIIFSIIFEMVFGMMPWQDINVFAYDEANYYVSQVAITKIYDDSGYDVTQTKLTITGRYLKGISVGTFTSTGYKVLTNPNPDFENVQEFIVDGDIVGDSIDIGNINIPIEQEELPTLSSVDKRSVNMGEEGLIITGSNLNKINDVTGKYGAYFQNVLGAGGDIPFSKENFNTVTDSVYIPPDEMIKGKAGLQNIVLKKEETINVDFENSSGIKAVVVTIQNTYIGQFMLVDRIKVENLVMNPNRGKQGDEIIFIATSGLDDYDVFFLKKLTDEYTNINKGQNTYFKPNVDGKQMLITHVPQGLNLGDYYVVVTNKIPDGQDINTSINKQMVIGTSPEYEKFTVIDASQKINIIGVDPDKGPDTGSEVEISGVFFGTLNIPKFTPSNPNEQTVKILEKDDGTKDEMTMEIKYSNGTYDKGSEGIPVISAKRTIKVIIGSNTTFAKDENELLKYSFSKGLDKIKVITPNITDTETDPIKDVVIETETIFKLDGYPNDIVIKDRGILENGYTFIPSKIAPKLESITPEIIQVTKISDDPKYEIAEEEYRMIAIYGQNFFVHKYLDEQNKEIVRYPIIEFGNGIKIDKNIADSDSVYLKVFNQQDREVDGSEGNEIGNKILIKIPGDTSITTIGKTSVKIINPVRNADTEGLYDTEQYMVEFVVPSQNKKPVIENVTPNIVTVDGGEEVTITGSNFQSGVKVFIDGKEVNGISLQGDGKKIVFKVPRGRECDTQLQVMNLEGGIAVHPFKYVKTYTDPKINGFSPKRGNTDTLVVVTGENFLKPDPTATESDINKLIGTKILLEGKDINEYNTNDKNQIVLKDYKASNEGMKLVKVVDGKVQLQDYYHSVILEDTENKGKYYTIDKTLNNEIILSNGSDETYKIENEGENIKAHKNGEGVYDLNVSQDGDNDIITLSNNIKLKLMTPFKVEDGIIKGDKVNALDINTIYFRVPILPGDGYYDVTVENPDTKKDSKLDQQGFYYYTQPSSRPNIKVGIDGIVPNEGSVDGGYVIRITGEKIEGRECFVDSNTSKTKVYIYGILVPDEDVTVGIDGTTLDVIVPKLDIDIKAEYGTDRFSVPIVITNPDGGSASREAGFTYIVPISHPEIENITPNNGNASGGKFVEITGKDFRFYEPYDDKDRDGKWDNDEEYQDLNNYCIKPKDDGSQCPDDLTGKNLDELKEKYGDRYDEIIKKILPKVYFGNEVAEIVEFDNGYIKVIAPRGETGPVDLYITNNDAGRSNKVTYTYEGSSPQIESISPGGGKKQGKDKVEIIGKDFFESEIKVYNKENDIYEKVKRNQVLVRFGDISNKNINREDPNSGRIDSGRTTVKLDGGLTVEYNGNEKKLVMSIIEDQKTYTATIPYDAAIPDEDNTVYVPISLLEYKDVEGNISKYVNGVRGDELIRFEVSDRRLFIERGYAPTVKYGDGDRTHIIVTTPSYYTIGVVPVTVINPDGGEANTTFEYTNPDTEPKIINITKDGKNPETIEELDKDTNIKMKKRIINLNYKGGNIVAVIGSNFRENATIQIGEIATIDKSKITYQLPNKLSFEMPNVGEEAVGKVVRVTVINEDLGNASSDELDPPIYIKITKGETSPSIESVTPNKGPAKGGTSVTIKGNNFREGLSVLIGDVTVSDVKVIDYKTVKITTPAHVVGTFEVKIENNDGELSDPRGEFTYLSAPNIAQVVLADPKDPENSEKDAPLDTLSVEGGQLIKIKGSGFMEGSRVVFSPEIKGVEEEAETGDRIYIEGNTENEKILVKGTDGEVVKIIDEGTLLVKTPPGKLDSVGIIIVNPDKGASNIYNIKYDLPETPVPTEVKAQVIYDTYIKVNWSGVQDENIKEYEIHVVVNDKEKYFIGSTELTSFIYKDIEPRTEYKFVVTAIGKYGSSKYSMESNEVETGSSVGPKDEDGELGDKTSIEKSGDRANILIGKDDYDEAMTIDLTRGELAGSKEVTIKIPAYAVASTDAEDITVIGSDFRFKFNPTTFYNSRIKENRRNNDAGVSLNIKSDNVNTNLETGKVGLSNVYVLNGWTYIGKEKTPIDYTSSLSQITLDVDQVKLNMRRSKSINLSRYDDDQWIPIANGNKDNFSIMGLTDKLGKFMIVGSRRE
ncbi:IPT/TIG domain-containing protein [Lutibacter sp. B2]|nr:IPT/TIG domain-containing protein [Lutibacter sp. B2]